MISNKAKKQFDWFHIEFIKKYHLGYAKIRDCIKQSYKSAQLEKLNYDRDGRCFVINFKVLKSKLVKELFS